MNITDLGRRIDTGEHRMNSMEERLDASFALLSSQILQSRRETNDAILAMRADLSGDITALRVDMSGEFVVVRREMAGEFSALRSEMTGEFATVRSEMAGEFSAVRSEMTGGFSAVRSEMSAMRSETQGCFEKFETTLVVGLQDTRHYMKLLYEDLLGRIALLGEAWPPRQ